VRSDVFGPWSQALTVLVIAFFSAVSGPSPARADDAPDQQDDDEATETDADDEAAKKPAPPPPPPPPPMPAKIDICMTSAVIAPTKSDGSPWDGAGAKLPVDELRFVTKTFTRAMKLSRMARFNPTAMTTELALIFAKPALQALAKPDVFGSIELAPKGAYTGRPELKRPIASPKKPAREFTPGFSDSVCFKGVTWHPDVRLRVNLIDQDVMFDDKIAMVEVISDNVRNAFAAGKPLHIYVGDQDTRQLQFVVLNVTRSADEDE